METRINDDDVVEVYVRGNWIPAHVPDCMSGGVIVANCCQANDEFLKGLTPGEVEECRILDAWNEEHL